MRRGVSKRMKTIAMQERGRRRLPDGTRLRQTVAGCQAVAPGSRDRLSRPAAVTYPAPEWHSVIGTNHEQGVCGQLASTSSDCG